MSRFDTYLPVDALKPYVRCIVISENEEEAEYKVLPGTSLVMGWQYKGRLSVVSDGSASALSSTGITGLQDRFRIFKNSKDTGTVLVYFTETGVTGFFRTPAHELFTQSISLDHFVGHALLNEVSERLSGALTDEERIRIVEHFLLSQCSFREEDALVNLAIRHIRESKGTLRIRDLARMLHTSPSPLEKRFRKIVGATPKKFASIVRFHAIVGDLETGKTLSEITYENNFFDQAHFIHDFRKYTGDTPERFLRFM